MPDSRMFLALILNMVFVTLLIVMVIHWLRLRYRRRMHQEFMAKFKSPEELSDFLKAVGSSEYFAGFALKSKTPKEKVLSAVLIGAVIGVLGLALVAVGLMFREFNRVFLILGILTTAAGAGFLIASAVSYRLGRRWDIFD